MKPFIHNLFFLGCIFYLPVILCALAGWKRWRNSLYLAASALLFLSAAVRVYYNWPLVCLFQEPHLIALTTAVVTGVLSMGIAYVALLFPGDIYTAFPKTNSAFARLFSLSSSLARAVYLCSAALALASIATTGTNRGKGGRQEQRLIGNLVILGFAAHSVSMFFGGFWSYVGWGGPLQWESRLFLDMAGIWFYYSLYLHLHLTRKVGSTTVLFAACLGGRARRIVRRSSSQLPT